jgi:hypothetical protein
MLLRDPKHDQLYLTGRHVLEAIRPLTSPVTLTSPACPVRELVQSALKQRPRASESGSDEGPCHPRSRWARRRDCKSGQRVFGKSRQRCLNRECLVRSPIPADCDITRYKTEALSHSLASFAARLAFATQSIDDESGMVRLYFVEQVAARG